MEVHTALGPGLLENAYRICLVHALRQQGFKVETEVAKPIEFWGVKLDAGFRIDMLVEDSVIVEIKACERTLPVHEAQLLSYLRLTDLRIGLLLNFHVTHMKDGLKRVVNKFPEQRN